MADQLTFYKSKLSRQWRWRYQAEGNHSKLANGGESYVNQNTAMESAFRLLALGSVRQMQGRDVAVIERIGGADVEVRVKH